MSHDHGLRRQDDADGDDESTPLPTRRGRGTVFQQRTYDAFRRVARHLEDEEDVVHSVLEEMVRTMEVAERAIDGCLLSEAGIPVDRVIRIARRITRRSGMGMAEAAWVADQLTYAGAEIDGEFDTELVDIRARRALLRQPGAADQVGEWRTLRDAEARRMEELKRQVLRRSGEASLGRLLGSDRTAYTELVERGARGVGRAMGLAA